MTSRPVRPLEWLQRLTPSKELPVKQWAVLVRLALAMGRDGTGWVTIERLAREAGVGEATAKRATSWAQGAGLLEQTSRGHRISDERRAASTYQLTLPNSSANEPLGFQHGGDPTAQNGDPTAQNGPPNSSANEPLVAPLQEPPYKSPDIPPSAGSRRADSAPSARIGDTAEELEAELIRLGVEDDLIDQCEAIWQKGKTHARLVAKFGAAWQRTRDKDDEAANEEYRRLLAEMDPRPADPWAGESPF